MTALVPVLTGGDSAAWNSYVSLEDANALIAPQDPAGLWLAKDEAQRCALLIAFTRWLDQGWCKSWCGCKCDCAQGTEHPRCGISDDCCDEIGCDAVSPVLPRLVADLAYAAGCCGLFVPGSPLGLCALVSSARAREVSSKTMCGKSISYFQQAATPGDRLLATIRAELECAGLIRPAGMSDEGLCHTVRGVRRSYAGRRVAGSSWIGCR